MKNLSITLNVVLLVAVAILFYLVLSEPKITEPVSKVSTEDTTSATSGLKIAYINTDTLWANYDLVKVLREELEDKQAQFKRQLEGKVKALESRYLKLREDAPMLTQADGEKRQMALMQEEEGIGQMQEELALKLAEEEDNMKRKIKANLDRQLAKMKEIQKLDLILDYSTTSSLLLADSTMNITTEVVSQLNADFKSANSK
ncbi:OmpH family outer membrane protein [Vicingaceae bacterium]|nr:OmpH family outer membrane protein [Vicingaceae bacterium]